MHAARSSTVSAVCTAALVWTASPAAAVAPPPAEPGVWAGNGHRYEVVSAPYVTWVEARDAAAALTWGEGDLCPGHLATPTSAAENDHVLATFGADALFTKWLGGIQPSGEEVETGWEWITGEAWDFTAWATDEPNNTYRADLGYEDALMYWQGGGWNDGASQQDRHATGGYVVEFSCRGVSIDVRPGNARNPVQRGARGVVPVAVLSGDGFDATTLDPRSVVVDGASVRARGRQGIARDVDHDGDKDLVLHVAIRTGAFDNGANEVALTGSTYDGVAVAGSDVIRVVPRKRAG